jgi:hypothetical protein
MSKSVLAPAVIPIRFANWGPMLVGIVCLGIGSWFAIGTLVDLDFVFANHLNSWPPQVFIEIGITMMLVGFGSWSLWRGVRSTARHK